MKKLALLCLSPIVLFNVAIAGGQNAPAYKKGHPHHYKHHQHKVHYFTGFAVTGALGGIAMELDAKQNFDGFSVAGDDASNPHTGSFGFSASDEVTASDNLELFEANIAGLIALEYNYQFDNGLVLGLAATAGFDNVEFNNTMNVTDAPAVDDVSADDAFKTFSTVSSTLKAKLENDFAILFKPGFVVREDTLIYALVGPRWGNFETKLSTSYNNNGIADINSACFSGCEIFAWNETLSDSSSNSEYEIGITAGVGIRQVLTDHFQLGLEYAYTHYGDLDSLENFASTNGPVLSCVGTDDCVDVAMDYVANAQDLIANTHTVMGTLSYRF